MVLVVSAHTFDPSLGDFVGGLGESDWGGRLRCVVFMGYGGGFWGED